MIKLIATDLDNTLLNKEGKIPDSTAALLHQAAEKGVLTAVATGRCFPSALGAARTIGAHTPVICYNGSLIKWGDTGEVLAKSYVEVDTMRALAVWCRERELFFQSYDYDDVIVCEEDGPGLRRDPDLAVVGFRIVEDFQTYADLHPTPKMLIVDWSDQVQARMAQLAQDFPMLDFCQSESYLIEVIPKGAGKGKALAQLAELMGVRQDEVMALGDNTNDLPMLRWAGLGVVVSNGVPSVKAEADYVCQAERSEGVEEALRKFVL